MAAYNAELFIKDAIQSVRNQTYPYWELIIINDGSTDDTMNIINNIFDSRITVINKSHKGVASSRNTGLKIMKGQYFCFLDSDDIFTPKSLSSRLKVFNENADISFVDGAVDEFDLSRNKFIRHYLPRLKGFPLNNLLKLNDKCFVGNSWMVKRDFNFQYVFDEKMTHCEDLYFYISICEGKKYDYTNNSILIYRKRVNSAMSDYSGLQIGYHQLYKRINTKFKLNLVNKFILKYKIVKIMTLIHFRHGQNFKSVVKSIYCNLLI